MLRLRMIYDWLGRVTALGFGTHDDDHELEVQKTEASHVIPIVDTDNL